MSVRDDSPVWARLRTAFASVPGYSFMKSPPFKHLAVVLVPECGAYVRYNFKPHDVDSPSSIQGPALWDLVPAVQFWDAAGLKATDGFGNRLEVPLLRIRDAVRRGASAEYLRLLGTYYRGLIVAPDNEAGASLRGALVQAFQTAEQEHLIAPPWGSGWHQNLFAS